MKKKIIFATGSLFAVLLSVMIMKSYLPSGHDDSSSLPSFAINKEAITAKVAKGLSIETVTDANGLIPAEPLRRYTSFLDESYPNVKRVMTREMINGCALVYCWKGSDASLPPLLVVSHIDVVPALDASSWTHAPFSGAVADGYVWGRGALDTKCSHLCALEAADIMISNGVVPRRTVYFSLGCDEELGGVKGAAEVAKIFKERKIHLSSVLDEGGFVASGAVPGVSKSVAVVGVAEKGYLSLVLTAKGKEGHSSVPPKQTTVGILCEAVTRLEKNPLPLAVNSATREFLETIAPEMSFTKRLLLSNLWLTEPVVKRALSSSDSFAAMMRTTTAATMLEASPRDNVISAEAKAVVNFRLLPGDTKENVIAHAIRAIDDPRVEVSESDAVGFFPAPSLVSSTGSDFYKFLSSSVRGSYPGTVVAPYLVTGATDSRYFAGIADSIYRFEPLGVKAEDLSGIHGRDEKISVDSLVKGVGVYMSFFERAVK